MLRAAGEREEALAEYRRSLAIREALAAADPGNVLWQADLVVNFYRISMVSEPAVARAALRRAITILDMLATNNRLPEAQAGWPQLMRDTLAKLPPEQAEAQ